jgi:hypothetical protein
LQLAVIALLLSLTFFPANAQGDFTLEGCRAMARSVFSAEMQREQISQSAASRQQLL